MSKRQKIKGRQEAGTFIRLPHALIDSDNWMQCSKSARALLIDIARQYNGMNNGDLCAAITTLKPYGWTRGETVSNLIRKLRHYGFLELTRQGGLNMPSLYALTWQPVNECNGKHDAKPTITGSGGWNYPVAKFKRPMRKSRSTYA